MRRWLGVWTFVGATAALIAVLVVGPPIEGLVSGLALAAALAWGLVVLTLPWDLHFQARRVLHEHDRSLARGLVVHVGRADIARVARRTLAVALLAHLGSAAGAALVAAAIDWPAGWLVAAAYVASCGFRPIGAWYTHLRAWLAQAHGEVTHPREDLLALRARVDRLEAALAATRGEAATAAAELAKVEATFAKAEAALRAEDRRLATRIDALARGFEDAVARLTDDRDLLAGIRAFLRMVRAPDGAPGA
jgi:hypothetical protein